MYKHYLEKLEFNKVVEKLSNYCATYKGRKMALSLLPSNDKDEVKEILNETAEAVNLAYRNSFPGLYEIADITVELKLLQSNSQLSAKALLNLANIFKLAQELKDYFNQDFLDVADYPTISNLFSELYSNKNVYSTIFEKIIDENTIDDKASKNLQSIRRKKRKLDQDIRSKLQSLIHSASYSKYIQENIVTIRNDRFVIPVKEEYRSQIKGFVHDVSNAGSTVFIEPISVFEMNNELASLKVEEELEIEKILLELSKLFFPYTNELEHDCELIGKLDFIFAKAKYSRAINANTPDISEKKEIYLKNARHPLIDADKVVPITLSLGKEFSSLVITGPNTGGKTVTLKTIGLLSCMACSGLNIPVDAHSSIYVFDQIFADIGDDQSISDSLSTFSSHLKNIVQITKNATANSLILLDELGSGTDPLEGANLAISILAYFKDLGALTVSTTHYQELKQYALVTDGFENASVEFDIATLSPTYKLLVGIPGKSNAFEISQKLGLNTKIIENAKKLMTSNQVDIENLLKSIYDDKSEIEKEKEQTQEELRKVTALRESLERDNYELDRREKEIINNAKIQARNILLDAKSEADDTIKELNKVQTNTQKLVEEIMQSKNGSEILKIFQSQDKINLEELRNTLNSKIKGIKLSNLSFSAENDADNSQLSELKPEDIKPNQQVFVRTLGKQGTIISAHPSKSNEVQVQIGSMKMNVNIKDLSLVKPANSAASNKNASAAGTKHSAAGVHITSKINSKASTVKPEINVIGLTVDDALPLIDKFLDDCSLAKLNTVRIVHGKGTGKLREGIHNFLKRNPHVKSYRMGTYGEGEMGVTVVEI